MSGTVTYKAKPLTHGAVTFVTEHGTASGAIDTSGAYTVEGVPVGNAKVSVFVGGAPKMPARGGPPKDKAAIAKDLPPEAQKMLGNMKKGPAAVTIPPKYNDTESSGLTVTVTSGKNPPYNIELKD